MLKPYACIWSNKSAAEMVKFYKSVFKGTKVGKWNTTKNKAKKEAMTLEMLKMKKLDIKKLKAAFDNA